MDGMDHLVQVAAMPYPGNFQLFIQDKVAEAGSPDIFAKSANTNFRNVYNWLNGIVPRQSTVNKLAKSLGVDPEIIYQYEGKGHGAKSSPGTPCAGCENFRLVPLVTAVPICGEGGLETDEEFIGWYSFRWEFLKRRGSPDSMRLYLPKGDSMEPTIKEGDMVLVDTSQTTPTTGQLALVRVDKDLMIKRVERVPGKVILMSDNSKYSPIEITPDNEDQAQIYGRMVWACREY
ncbi:MAG: helix-turn-helix transcriptional regulator [Desulfovibrio sp.]